MKKGGIYTSTFSTNILIDENPHYYFIADIDNVLDLHNQELLNRQYIITVLNRLIIQDKLNICFADKSSNYFEETQDGYLGKVPELIHTELEILLKKQNWYQERC